VDLKDLVNVQIHFTKSATSFLNLPQQVTIKNEPGDVMIGHTEFLKHKGEPQGVEGKKEILILAIRRKIVEAHCGHNAYRY
jgi:hypothetical protein